MADKKISALTGASTPLAGTEVLPIVQSSSTVKVSVANLTAGRAVSASSLALTTPLPTTSGGTALSSFTNKGVVYASSTSALATGSALEFDGTNFGVGTGGNTMNHQSVIYRGGANAVYQQIGNGLTGLGATQGIRLGLTSAAASELYTINSFNIYVDGSSAISISSARDTTFTGGNLIQGTAAKGINFTANTPAAGMTSQLLNWYEEGTWTPTLNGSGTAGTYELATASGWYTRVGRSITVIFNVKLAAAVTGGGTGFAVLGGLPFNTATTNAAAGAVTLGGVNYTAGTNYVTVMPRSIGSSQLIFEEVNINGAVNDVAISAFGVNDTIQGTLTYIV